MRDPPRASSQVPITVGIVPQFHPQENSHIAKRILPERGLVKENDVFCYSVEANINNMQDWTETSAVWLVWESDARTGLLQDEWAKEKTECDAEDKVTYAGWSETRRCKIDGESHVDDDDERLFLFPQLNNNHLRSILVFTRNNLIFGIAHGSESGNQMECIREEIIF